MKHTSALLCALSLFSISTLAPWHLMPVRAADRLLATTWSQSAETSMTEAYGTSGYPGGGCHGCDSCGDCCGCYCPEVYFVADALFLDLNRPDTQPVVLQQNSAVALSSEDLRFANEIGPRVTFGYGLSRTAAVEATYFGVYDWNTTALVEGANLRLPGDLGAASDDFFDASQMQVGYAAELHNVEVNLLRRYRWVSWLAGARYLNLDEDFDILSTDADTDVSQYRIGASNHLYGGQVGVKLNPRFDVLGLEFVTKAGLYGNSARQRTFVSDMDNTVVLRDTNADGGGTAFIGEMGVTGTFQVTQILALRLGYNLIWIEGLARAPDQLDFTNTATSSTTVNDNSDAILHGAHVGFEVFW